MASNDLPNSVLTKQVAFDQRGLHSTPEFERAMDRRCHVLVSKLETLSPGQTNKHCLAKIRHSACMTCLYVWPPMTNIHDEH